VYRLTEAGVRRARELLASIDATPVEIDGRRTTLGEARAALGMPPLVALSALASDGRFVPPVVRVPTPGLLQRDQDLALLRRWMAGGAPVAVVYGSKGMGKTALGRAFARAVPRAVWIDVAACADLPAFAAALSRETGREAPSSDPQSVAEALLSAFEGTTRLLVIDGYSEPPEAIVEALATGLRMAGRRTGVKVLVLAQETTPSYCRFYGHGDVESGAVVERHLKGLDLDACRAFLGNPSIDEEALRRVYLLTKGCPLYLTMIKEGDEVGLKAHSRFTTAEIRLLLYSGRAGRPAASAS
jgi:hypothetical protein